MLVKGIHIKRENEMPEKMVDVTLHIDENTSHDEREGFRDSLLAMEGVMAATFHDEKPHLIIIEYDPDVVKSVMFVQAATDYGWRAELVGL